jgi:glyoxylase-like metal-dependent hydrolase (beta-lactamase superfamily II)
MRITAEIYLIGGGPTFGFGLSPDPDCHVYLIDGGTELALIDCGLGTPESVEQIIANLRAEGLDPERVTTLILTHYHMDHAGGAARFREQLGLRVVAPVGAAAALRTGDEAAVALEAAKRAGLYPPQYRFEPVEVDRVVSGGDHLQVGTLPLEVIDTPGHCDGHASYLLHGGSTRSLFAGDAVFAGGRVVLQNIHDCHIGRSADSVARLAALPFDAFLPGHGPIGVHDGQRHVRRAVDTFNQLFVPQNLAG